MNETNDSPEALAGELRAAAVKLRRTAKPATRGPWERPLNTRTKAHVTAALPADEQGAYRSGYHPVTGERERVGVVSVNTWSSGRHVRKRGGRDLEWIALVHPGLAEPLAALLDAVADLALQHGDTPSSRVVSKAIAAADVLNRRGESLPTQEGQESK